MISRLTLFLGLLFLTDAVLAQRWYHVELLVFERLSGAYAERWPEMTVVRKGSLTPDMKNNQIQPARTGALAGVAKKLNANSDYHVLYHHAWLQTVLSKDRAQAVRIQSADGLIDGVLKLFKLGNINADIDLWLKENTASTYYIPTQTGSITVNNPHLHEIRRIKSRKLIYFDHPRVAAILRIRPL